MTGPYDKYRLNFSRNPSIAQVFSKRSHHLAFPATTYQVLICPYAFLYLMLSFLDQTFQSLLLVSHCGFNSYILVSDDVKPLFIHNWPFVCIFLDGMPIQMPILTSLEFKRGRERKEGVCARRFFALSSVKFSSASGSFCICFGTYLLID